jgi:serine phosphatase RsbU (regulator of sigma subunit)
MKAFLQIIIVVLAGYFVHAQEPNFDSIARIKDDTVKINLYMQATRYYRYHNQTDKALQTARFLHKFSNSKKFTDRKLGSVYKQIGNAYEITGLSDSALIFYKKSYNYYKNAGYKLGQAAILLDLGILNFTIGDFKKSIDYLEKAKTQAKEIQFIDIVIHSLNNLGNIYFSMRRFSKANDSFTEAIEIGKSIKDPYIIGHGYLSLAKIMIKREVLDSALYFSEIALKNFETTSSSIEISDTYEVFGVIYRMKNNYPKSLESYLKGLELKRQNKIMASYSIYQNLAALYSYIPDEQKSLAYYDTASTLINHHNMPTDRIGFYANHGKILAKFGRFEAAYQELYKSYVLRDSLMSDEKFAELEEIRTKHEIERAEDKIRTEESVKQAEERAKLESEAASLKQRNTLIISGVLFILLVISIFSVMLFKRVKISRRQNRIISSQRDEVVKQKHLVEEKQHEIIDSIQYAKRLQDAILPSDHDFSDIGSDRFVLYLPKDIVAGDFYWIEKYENQILVASADCTGHGVPGAMVSVICSNALNKAVVEERVLEPDKILNRVREILIKRFSKSGEQVKDGMDISLVALTHAGAIGQQSLQWSGANNPLWIIRKGAESIEEIKPDKQPVGYSYDMKPFTNHHLSLQQGDTIYLLTDGYQDQFGGVTANEYLQASMKAKKFKSSSLKNLLLSIQHQTMEEQKATLIKTLYDWKKDIEQIDDISIVGIRI